MRQPATAAQPAGGLKPPSEMAAGGTAGADRSIVSALKTVYDPEIPADIYELGLIYNVDIDDERFVTIEMTLTAPACPVAGEMPGWVENAVGAVAGRGGRQGEHGVRPAVGPKPHVRRSAGGAGYVVIPGEPRRAARRQPRTEFR